LSASSSFASLVTSTTTRTVYTEPDELCLLPKITDGLGSPFDWSFTASTVLDPDNASFFQKTRMFAFQHFIRLLVARHQFSMALGRNKRRATGQVSQSSPEVQEASVDEMHEMLGRIIRCALLEARWRMS
jgi:hypothetical protein